MARQMSSWSEESVAFARPMRVTGFGHLIQDFRTEWERFVNGKHIARTQYPEDINLLEFLENCHHERV